MSKLWLFGDSFSAERQGFEQNFLKVEK